MRDKKNRLPRRRLALSGLLLVCLSIILAAQTDPTPRRIISLVPAVTEMLFAIGAGPQLVGVGTFDELPDQGVDLPRVGGLLDPDMERILSLRPDLIAIYATQTDTVTQIERAQIPIFAYQHGGLADITSTIRSLGVRTGRRTGAERAATDLERALDDLATRVQGRPTPQVMLVFGREPGTLRNLYASGGVGFLHDLLEIAGGRNVFEDLARESVQPTLEAVIAAAPDVIIELAYDQPREPDMDVARVWRSLGSVPAVGSGRVYVLAGTQFVVPGPRVVTAAQAIARLLHPDAF